MAAHQVPEARDGSFEVGHVSGRGHEVLDELGDLEPTARNFSVVRDLEESAIYFFNFRVFALLRIFADQKRSKIENVLADNEGL